MNQPDTDLRCGCGAVITPEETECFECWRELYAQMDRYSTPTENWWIM